jgi:hypothetical protein
MQKYETDRIWLAALAALLAVAVVGTAGALNQVGKTFPGFLLLGNRVVASIGLPAWPGTAGGKIFQYQVVAVDSVPAASAEAIRARVRDLPAGTPIEYRLRKGDREILMTIATRNFNWRDFTLLHGLFLVNGICIAFAALVAIHRRRSSAARACAPLLVISALWVLTALELYGPNLLFRLHALCEAMLFPAALVMALGFPSPSRYLIRYPWLPRALYGGGACLALAYQASLHHAVSYSAIHLLALSAFGLSLLTLVVGQVERLRRPLSDAARERLKVVAMGAVVALTVPIAFTLAETLTGGSSPQNALALTGGIFPLALSYALMRSGEGGHSGRKLA